MYKHPGSEIDTLPTAIWKVYGVFEGEIYKRLGQVPTKCAGEARMW